MQVFTACPHCSAKFQVSKTVIGKRTRCTKCSEAFVLTESPASSSKERQGARKPQTETDPIDAISNEPPQNRAGPASIPPVPPPSPNFNDEIASTPIIKTNNGEYDQFRPFSVTRNYLALRFIARTLEIIGIVLIVLLVLAIAITIYDYSRITEHTSEQLIGLLGEIFGMSLAVGIMNLVLFFFSNSIRLAIQIERNTHQSQERLQDLSNQVIGLSHTLQNTYRKGS